MRYQPQRGDYGIVKTNGIIGYLIQLGTLTQYNHAFIYVSHDQIIEATPRHGVKISPVLTYDNIVWNQHEARTDEQRDAIVREALKHLGNRYSFIDYLAIVLSVVGLRVPKVLTNHLGKSTDEICSQLTVRAIRAAGIPIEGKKPDFLVKPSDLIYRLLYI